MPDRQIVSQRALDDPLAHYRLHHGPPQLHEGSGREFIWDFEKEARRIRPIASRLAIGEEQLAELQGARVGYLPQEPALGPLC